MFALCVAFILTEAENPPSVPQLRDGGARPVAESTQRPLRAPPTPLVRGTSACALQHTGDPPTQQCRETSIPFHLIHPGQTGLHPPLHPWVLVCARGLLVDRMLLSWKHRLCAQGLLTALSGAAD